MMLVRAGAAANEELKTSADTRIVLIVFIFSVFVEVSFENNLLESFKL